MAIHLCPESCKFEPYQCRTCYHVWTLSGLVIWKKFSQALESLLHGLQEPSCSCRSPSQRYLSFILVKSCVQKLRCLNLLAIPHHVTGISSSCPKLYCHLQCQRLGSTSSIQTRRAVGWGLFSDGGDFLRTETQWLFLIPVPTLAVRLLTPHHHALDKRIWSYISSSGHRWPLLA